MADKKIEKKSVPRKAAPFYFVWNISTPEDELKPETYFLLPVSKPVADKLRAWGIGIEKILAIGEKIWQEIEREQAKARSPTRDARLNVLYTRLNEYLDSEDMNSKYQKLYLQIKRVALRYSWQRRPGDVTSAATGLFVAAPQGTYKWLSVLPRDAIPVVYQTIGAATLAAYKAAKPQYYFVYGAWKNRDTPPGYSIYELLSVPKPVADRLVALADELRAVNAPFERLRKKRDAVKSKPSTPARVVAIRYLERTMAEYADRSEGSATYWRSQIDELASQFSYQTKPGKTGKVFVAAPDGTYVRDTLFHTAVISDVYPSPEAAIEAARKARKPRARVRR